MTYLSEPHRDQFLDDESFDRADADYWAWYDREEDKRNDFDYVDGVFRG